MSISMNMLKNNKYAIVFVMLILAMPLMANELTIHSLKVKLHFAILGSDKAKIKEVNEELKRHKSVHIDRYLDTLKLDEEYEQGYENVNTLIILSQYSSYKNKEYVVKQILSSIVKNKYRIKIIAPRVDQTGDADYDVLSIDFITLKNGELSKNKILYFLNQRINN